MKNQKFSKLEMFLFSWCVILMGAIFIGGVSLSNLFAKDSFNQGALKELKVFTDVLSIVKRDYVKEPETKALVKGAIKGMLTTLDPHSGYLDPDFYKDLQVQTKGEFGGLGIEITIKDGVLVVVAPMEGSPAEEAGVKAGDSIVKIEGRYTKEFSLVDAVRKLRGPRGSPIKISIAREGVAGLIDVTVIREKIEVRSVRSRYLGDRIGYIRLNQFMEKTADDLKLALDKFISNVANGSLDGLVLDLRNNPGGLLTQAVRICDMFLTEGLLVYTDGRIEAQKQKFFAHTRGTEPDYPIVVLVNGGSASASEIVSGAFQDHGRALVLGTPTFGKGSVQTITPLENGGAVTLTTALYYTKSGNSLQAQGVTPDIIVELEKDENDLASRAYKVQKLKEKDLPGAIKDPDGSDNSTDVLRKINKTPVEELPRAKRIDPETEPIESWLDADAQLRKAVEILKNWKVMENKGDFVKNNKSA